MTGPALITTVALATASYGLAQPPTFVHDVEPPGSGPAPPNIVLILLDDIGVDMVGAYGHPVAPCTPNIDVLAAQGMLFRNCWTNPLCSPTRAQILTGRHSFRTGVGTFITVGNNLQLSLEERTIAEELPATYTSSAVGKWHLTQLENVFDPLDQGFDWFAGSMSNLPGYYNWERNENGIVTQEMNYATTVTTDDAIQRVTAMPEPWFLYVPYNAAHSPWELPPAGLCPASVGCFCHSDPNDDPQLARAITEALDTEIGRLLAAVYAVDPDAYVFLMGDNGTPEPVQLEPLQERGAKSSLWEGGVHVPLIATGPGIAAGESATLVCATDLFATILELAGAANMTGDDSLSFAPTLLGIPAPIREFNFAEKFGGTGGRDHRAVRDLRWKLRRTGGRADRLYDLDADPLEQTNLFPPNTQAEAQAYARLIGELSRLGRASADLNGDGWVNITDLGILLSFFGVSDGATYGQGDIDGDGAVTITDLV